MPEDNPPPDVSPRAAVARRIAALRHARGLSLTALAARAGIGKGTLSELESGTRNPTLETLYALAGPLGVPLTGLVGDEAGRSVSDGVVDAHLLSVRTHDDGGTTEVFWLTLAPGGTRISPAHRPGTVEHFRVVRGRGHAGERGAEQGLGPGEAHSWPGDTVHTYGSEEGAEGVLVIETPGDVPGPS
ncbi:helix-turn-helix transcriptional regulator [Arthrobacter agilis]|uniref:helix-turn-helix domain-containing protein n=1 Tax=Arthrobacter agilis TaxID=37921 RepID=UPI000B350D8F|nr:helix-turn-helix domain-containing protein [Arthrobacter agilis]OUM40696.1 transcriptional regulator [Arthrobacter agilis]PPB45305.1 helix-turn-helix domain-containing protein [Arthrobacter agilis]TPV28014.1 helix-turn-helix transcriptional regulator [Arthrobacter agilis]VDR31294.1 anaerobic benzoate catabolism transcriptional regulator [Arthrobacter agilis]